MICFYGLFEISNKECYFYKWLAGDLGSQMTLIMITIKNRVEVKGAASTMGLQSSKTLQVSHQK